MESTGSSSPMVELIPPEIPPKDEKTLDKTDSKILESDSSDEEEKEKQLTIADIVDEQQIKESIDLQQDVKTQENRDKEQESSDFVNKTEDKTIESDTTMQSVFTLKEKDELVEGIKQVESQIPKLNGNHSLSMQNDEDTCSSITSSASSHNLVIDHPLAEELSNAHHNILEDNAAIDMRIEEKSSLKRKLSSCENDSPQYKQIHLDVESSSLQRDLERTQHSVEQPTTVADVPVIHTEITKSPPLSMEIVRNPPKVLSLWETSKEPPAPTPPPQVLLPSPYEQYATSSSNSLPPPKLNFECFKCKNAVFETFTHLRDHHKVCLFKDNHRKLPKTPTVTPACQNNSKEAYSQHSEFPAPPPPQTSAAQTKKRFYLCSSCGTYHENWNLFLHIREIHNRHVCLYCIRLFPTAEKLSLHLEIKHDLEQNHFNSEERLRSVSKGDGNSRFLMCCTCQHVFSEHERFSDHVCTEYMQPCSLCSQKGRHLNNCKANPEKRPKVKKKAKTTTTPATVIKSNIQAPKSTSITPTPTPTAPSALVCDNKCNNNQLVLSTLPLTLQTVPNLLTPSILTASPTHEFSKQNGFSEPAMNLTQKPSEDYNYHSDDSTNMVIDETCNNNSYVHEMAAGNPFKALDERERLEEEGQKIAETKTTLPPDRVPEAIPEPKPLIVPKIKLRVPKEFQKAVESEISSSDSDEEEEDEDVEEDVGKQQNSENPTVDNTNEELSDEAGSMDEKENTQDWNDDSNSNLDRILKEIEKTKLDIQRTKEMLEPMNNLKKIPTQVEEPTSHVHSKAELPICPGTPQIQEPTGSSAQPEVEGLNCSAPTQEEVPTLAPRRISFSPGSIDNSKLEEVVETAASVSSEEIPKPVTSSWATPERGMYSPTPPPTPNSVWPSPLYLTEVSPAVLQAVSERENIENMEKESEHAKEQTLDSDKMDTSGELDTDSLHNQEESTMDIEEKVRSLPQSSSPSSAIDFSLNEENIDVVNPTEIAEEPSPPPPEVKEEEKEDEEIEVEKDDLPPADGIQVASDDIQITDLLLDRPIEKFEIVEFVRLCVKAVYSLCLYCNHARRIAVSGHSLVLHLLSQHRFAATVDSITAEELLPSTIVSKLKSFLPDLEEHYFNLQSYCTMPPIETNVIACDERHFECFQCRFSTKMHKDLYLHNRKMHLKTAILCFMCRANFFSFSEILCHICPGQPNNVTMFDIKFRCCLCHVDGIPSPFRLMVHLRKKHFACDICLEDCREQGKLSSHVWKHKLHHLCYRCGIAYRNKMDITKHLFWKHGTESIICKRCLQKRWRHVYHFCVPPTSFVCELCNLCFSKATYLKVHKRVHTGDFRYPCTEDNCDEKFISRKLLLKHSATHAPPPEIKVEEKGEVEVDAKQLQEDQVKLEVDPQAEKCSTEASNDKDVETKVDEKKSEKSLESTSKRKKKKNRNKESLEDLNLIAPNLSESDSSDESDAEKPKTDDKDSVVPNVMLSPFSDEDKDDDKESPSKQADKDTGKILDIWENFKSFQASQQTKQEEDDNVSLSESNYPTPILHVACSDHDYCAMFKIRPRVPVEDHAPVEPEQLDNASDTERNKHDSSMREKSISPTKKKRKSTGSGSSSSDSSSGSDSSCSCGSNCSCSTSGSSSNSSSSSDDDSDSSTSEGRRRIAEKKQDRADRNRWKSESSIKASLSEPVDVVTEDKEPIAPVVKENLEPVLIETDLETVESETDEEFYDEHPQKLASEMLAQKRLQLRAQKRLSPSHNFDIIENSRPSTPSLPEEMVKEKKVKLKKKKRDRKSTSKSQAQAVPPIKLNLSVNKVEIKEPAAVHQTSMQVPEVDLVPPYDLIASPSVAEPPVAQQPPLTPTTLQNNTMRPVPFFHSRMSEGSSCSDADNSLKRSKRARRPNKFYGYTSDDEGTPGTPLMIGTRTFKPQPPPQLTWRKEDLPAPSKSILLNKQPRSPRTPKTAAGSSGQAKKRVHQKSSLKKKQHRLPPIPTLKIRPSKIGIGPPIVPAIATLPPPPPPPPAPANHTYSSSRDESEDSDSSDDDLEFPAANTLIPTATVPQWNTTQTTAPPTHVAVHVEPPPPPAPQASVFNQKIPPALLPNPDFATIQYFKRNNIRYPIRPPAGARQPRDGESVYCYCRCPYDEVSEMIACDGENCLIEWFHFECVGIMVAPQGKWFCAECRPKYSNELYPKL